MIDVPIDDLPASVLSLLEDAVSNIFDIFNFDLSFYLCLNSYKSNWIVINKLLVQRLRLLMLNYSLL
jgi:hypothetical protein